MGVSDTIRELVREVAQLFKELTSLGVKVEGVERDIDRVREDQQRLIDRTRGDVREMKADFDDLRRRVSKLEGLTESVLQASMKEALLQLGREHIEKHGSLKGFDPARLPSARGPEDEGAP